VMAAAWSMPVEFVPPRISVVIDKKTFTRELVKASGHFALCIPGAGVARLVHAVGSETGRAGAGRRHGGLAGVPPDP
jgi:flavin reductase (DIM6/NTAB) family NADH-FMN oxidoreductase RutF